MDLLEADDAEFGRRCQATRDEEGRAMLGELAGQLQRLGVHVAHIGEALSLTAERVWDRMTTLA